MKLLKLLFPTRRVPTLDEFVPMYWAIEVGDPDKLEEKRKQKLLADANYFN